MRVEEAVTQWIAGMKAGEAAAVEKLWQAYFQQLVQLARKKLRDAPRRAADEEDVALSAFKSFCLGAQQGRFPQMVDREGLWALLVAITSHKSADYVRHERRDKRGGKVKVEQGSGARLDEIIVREPTPEFALQIADTLHELLALLDDEVLRTIALSKMEGYSVDEIAERLSCAPRTVKRKLQRIRTLWSEPASS